MFLAGQWWRLITAMFVHLGWLHLVLNLWCLLKVGPMVERLFGNLTFAALYLLSGLGGSIASVWWNRNLVSVGASGAIFGIFGALLAFLSVHHRTIPASVLKPLRLSTAAFVAFNVLGGLGSPLVDNACHVGGLGAGLLGGLALARPWPVRATAGGRAAARRLAGVAAMAVGLSGAYVAAGRSAERDPRLASFAAAVEAINSLTREIAPSLEEFDDINLALDRALGDLRRGGDGADRAYSALDGLFERSRENLSWIRQARPDDPKLQPAVDALRAAQEELSRAIEALRHAIESDDPGFITQADGFNDRRKASQARIEEFLRERERYGAAHGLTFTNPGAGDGPTAREFRRPDLETTPGPPARAGPVGWLGSWLQDPGAYPAGEAQRPVGSFRDHSHPRKIASWAGIASSGSWTTTRPRVMLQHRWAPPDGVRPTATSN